MKAPKKSNHHSCDYKTNHDYDHDKGNHHDQKSNDNHKNHDYHHKAKLRQKNRSEKYSIRNSV